MEQETTIKLDTTEKKLVSQNMDLIQSLDILKPLGSGSYATAYLAIDKVKGKNVVVKIMPLAKVKQDGKIQSNIRNLRWEATALEKIRPKCKPFLLCMDYVAIDIQGTDDLKNKAYFVFDYLEGYRDFHTIVAESKINFDIYAWYIIIENLLLGLKDIHDHDVVHRDIKGENIMLNAKDLTPVYIDFGFACMETDIDCLSTSSGTLEYAPPESLKKSRIVSFEMSKAGDIWSLGMTIIIMYTKKYPPWITASRVGLNKIIRDLTQLMVDTYLNNLEATDKHMFTPVIVNLVRQMLQIEPTKRAKIDDLIQLHWASSTILLPDKPVAEAIEEIRSRALPKRYPTTSLISTGDSYIDDLYKNL